MFRFKSFQGRLVFFFLGLVSLIQVIVFVTVDATNLSHAREQIETALELGARNFRRLIDTQLEVREGRLLLPQRPGLGFDFVAAALERYALTPWLETKQASPSPREENIDILKIQRKSA